MPVSPNPYERETGELVCADCGSKRWHLFPRGKDSRIPEICQGCLGLPDPDGPLKWEPTLLYPKVIGYRLRRSWKGQGAPRAMGSPIPSLYEYASREWSYPDILAEEVFDDGCIVRTCSLEHPSKHGHFYATWYINPLKNLTKHLGSHRVKEEARYSHPFLVKYAEGRRRARGKK